MGNPLADAVVGSISSGAISAEHGGRRLRVFAHVIAAHASSECIVLRRVANMVTGSGVIELATLPPGTTYAAALAAVDGHEALTALPLRDPYSDQRVRFGSIAEMGTVRGAAKQATWLQDLADEVFVDVHDACAALRDPGLWYPGVDEGIEPVSDNHVALVIAGLERELRFETRPPVAANGQVQQLLPKLPPAPLSALPWHIQRALVERRRLRFRQWGIGRAQWEAGTFSLWDVPEDSEWVPRWPPPDARGPHAGRW